MGNGMTCATTPIAGVAQGSALTHKTGLRHCATPCPPKGGRAGVAQPWHVQSGSAGVAHDLVPMPRLSGGDAIAGGGVPLSLPTFWEKFRGVV